MNIFEPLMIQSSPERTARVRIARAGSLPPDGSVSAKKPFFAAQHRHQITLLLVVVGLEQLREARAAEYAITLRTVRHGAATFRWRARDEVDPRPPYAAVCQAVEPHFLDLRYQPPRSPPATRRHPGPVPAARFLRTKRRTIATMVLFGSGREIHRSNHPVRRPSVGIGSLWPAARQSHLMDHQEFESPGVYISHLEAEQVAAESSVRGGDFAAQTSRLRASAQ
jgi:hypothetical protein